MYKVTICGHFGLGKNFYDGQTVKTHNVYNALSLYINKNEINIIDTYNWKKNPFKLLWYSIKASLNSKNIIILPAHKGVKIFIPLFAILKLIFRYKMHYVVIGGWLENLIKDNRWIRYFLLKTDYLYVETNLMKSSLQKNFSLNNVLLMKNFKELNMLKKSEIKIKNKRNYKFCTFSRVMEEKGIEDAISVVLKMNKEIEECKFFLDIYGPIDKNYINKFEELIKNFPDCIRYCGSINPNKSVDIIKNYDLLLFPTHFFTEGIPGTILDSFAAGVPVIASKWQSAEEVVEDDVTGYIFKFNDLDDFEKKIKQYISLDEELKLECKFNCIKSAYQYFPKTAVLNLIKNLKN